jgi:hypothetical protein
LNWKGFKGEGDEAVEGQERREEGEEKEDQTYLKTEHKWEILKQILAVVSLVKLP